MTTPSDKIIILPDSLYLSTGTKEGRQKITIGITGTSSHFTITNNGSRRVINAHITYDDHIRAPEYLCELSYFTWARLLVRMKQLLLPLQQQFFLSRMVNLGRLKRHGLFLSTGNPDPDTEKALVQVNGNKTYIRSRRKVRASALDKLLKYPDDIPMDDGKFYFLFSPHRKAIQGMIFRNPFDPNSRRYFFITNKMYRQFCQEYNFLFYSILAELHFKNKEKLLRLLEEKLIPQTKFSRV